MSILHFSLVFPAEGNDAVREIESGTDDEDDDDEDEDDSDDDSGASALVAQPSTATSQSKT